ncbi:MAG: terpene cyclase/mutase family protein [Verrucomicrobia bacterium]|nr:terpene cyclase/mutase family protein [Verrucomicrobiota bacterium]
MAPPSSSFILTTLFAALCVTSNYGKDAPPTKTKNHHKDPVIHSATDIENAIDRGVAFLLKDQNITGSWGSPHNSKGLNIYAPNPIASHKAYRAAVTAMCVSALIESGHPAKSPEALKALERGEAWLMEELPKVRRATPDVMYNVWAHSYGIQALVHMHKRAKAADQKEKIKDIEQLILNQIDRLQRYESIDGGWGYYDFRAGTKRPASSSISFTTATTLVALHEAKQIGIAVPDKLVNRAIKSIGRQRKNDNSYLYGEYLKMRPLYGINRPAGSLGRSQACNIALRYWGDKTITDEVLVTWLERLRDRNGWLSIGRKRPVPHESWFAIAGYFFYFGHYYASLCVEDLPPEKSTALKNDLAHIILSLQEKDGDWWDFPLYNYHRQYGTAFSIMTLSRCLP